MNTEKDNQLTNESIKNRVFDAITETGVQPRSKYVFWCQNWLVWGLWAVSIVCGALAIAVLLFVSTHRYYDMYEATHENFITLILEALPYIWFVVFTAMLAFAVWQLKHTKRGYRLSVPVLGVSSFVFSIVLGGLFHLGGFGWSLDMWLGKNAPMYVSQAEMERKMWQNPSEGRLVGRQLPDRQLATATVMFADVGGDRWLVRVTDLSPEDIAYLSSGEQVRLLGAANTVPERSFHACGVFPWMLDARPAMARVSKERQVFVDRMYKYYEDAEARRKAIEVSISDSETFQDKESPCYQLAAVRRVHAGMQ